jgi:hypothetical protein
VGAYPSLIDGSQRLPFDYIIDYVSVLIYVDYVVYLLVAYLDHRVLLRNILYGFRVEGSGWDYTLVRKMSKKARRSNGIN